MKKTQITKPARLARRRIAGRLLNCFNAGNKSGAGFTLIELLVVIVVVGTLAGGIISIVNPAAQLQKARDARRKTDFSQIQKAFETFYQDVGRYPASNASYQILRLDNSAVVWGTAFLPYMTAVPEDPNNSKNYVYYSPNGQTYYLYASLDRGGADPQACKSDGSKCNNAPVGACGTGVICNYGVSSPNVSP